MWLSVVDTALLWALMLGSRQTPQCWWCTGWHSLRAHQCLPVSAYHLVNRKFALWWKSTALERTWSCCNESLWRWHLPKSLPPKYQRWVPGSPTPSCSWSFFFAWDQAHSYLIQFQNSKTFKILNCFSERQSSTWATVSLEFTTSLTSSPVRLTLTLTWWTFVFKTLHGLIKT